MNCCMPAHRVRNDSYFDLENMSVAELRETRHQLLWMHLWAQKSGENTNKLHWCKHWLDKIGLTLNHRCNTTIYLPR